MLDYFLFYILLCLEGAYAPNAPLPSGLNVSVSQTLNKHLDTQRPVTVQQIVSPSIISVSRSLNMVDCLGYY